MNVPSLIVRPIVTAQDSLLPGLIEIYTQAHPANERKSVAELEAMLRRPEYHFLVAERNAEAVGFAICLELDCADAMLLEYLAIRHSLRGHGYGSEIFRAAAHLAENADRFLIIEVDAETAGASATAEAVRRKQFYRRLGCREMAGLVYQMPALARDTPPPMQLMLWKQTLPEAVPRTQLRLWLASIYRKAYHQPADDPRMEAMLKPLAAEVRLMRGDAG
jgi:ribosomal protein S18 acetylase RimI-like enzyme